MSRRIAFDTDDGEAEILHPGRKAVAPDLAGLLDIERRCKVGVMCRHEMLPADPGLFCQHRPACLCKAIIWCRISATGASALSTAARGRPDGNRPDGNRPVGLHDDAEWGVVFPNVSPDIFAVVRDRASPGPQRLHQMRPDLGRLVSVPEILSIRSSLKAAASGPNPLHWPGGLAGLDLGPDSS